MICEKCGNPHNGMYGSGRFCSSKCAHSKVFSDESKLKKSLKSKAFEQTERGKKLRLLKIKSMTGKGNIRYTDGSRTLHDKIKQKIYRKYNGICVECGKKLTKDRHNENTYCTHHIDITLAYKNKREYYSADKRILLCLNCHNIVHQILRRCRSGQTGKT